MFFNICFAQRLENYVDLPIFFAIFDDQQQKTTTENKTTSKENNKLKKTTTINENHTENNSSVFAEILPPLVTVITEIFPVQAVLGRDLGPSRIIFD